MSSVSPMRSISLTLWRAIIRLSACIALANAPRGGAASAQANGTKDGPRLRESAIEVGARAESLFSYLNQTHPDQGDENAAAVVDAAVPGEDDADLGIGEVRLDPGGRDHRLDAGGGQEGKDVQHDQLLDL